MQPKIRTDTRRAFNKIKILTRNAVNIPWNEVGRIVQDSVDLNFAQSGRPVKWVPRKVDSNRPLVDNHPILIDTGTLRDSIYRNVVPNGVEVGSKEKYQAVHNFGYPPKGIPQRKYLMVQPQDILKIHNTIENNMKRGIER